MQIRDSAGGRDAILAVAFLSARVLFAVCAAAARLTGSLGRAVAIDPAPVRTAEVFAHHLAEDALRWETLAVLQQEAASAIAEAEEAYRQAVVACAGAMTGPQKGQATQGAESAPLAA